VIQRIHYLTNYVTLTRAPGSQFEYSNSLHVRFNLKAGYNFISTVTPGDDLIASYNDRLEAIRNVGFFTVFEFENLTTSTHIPSFGAEIEWTLFVFSID
jgi:hypothetical protein